MHASAIIFAALIAQAAPPPDAAVPAASTLSRAAATITWEPSSLVTGAPCLFRVKPPFPLMSLSGSWLARPVVFDFDAAGATWFALGGVGLDVTEGEYPLELEGVDGDGSKVSFRAEIPIRRSAYRTVVLRVARKFTRPNAPTRSRIAREQQLKQDLFARITPERAWGGRFLPPLSSTPTDSFGVRRTFNGVQQSVHRGTDFRARTGTPVAAMNSGRVILARSLFFEGRCIVIDHGQGLLTLYMHLSKFSVEEGDRVERGQLIGSSGATGRVTGPHLHVSVRWHGLYLDPRTLLTLPLP
jgi:murein DD-endopeptidase MepM/ murein hydrolase activator NlpD